MMYEQWEQDPSSVHASWHAYFSGLDNDGNSSFELPPSIGQSSYEKKLEQISELLAGGAKAEVGAPTGSVRTSVETANVYRLIRAHQTHGHLMADVDPIGLAKAYENDPELTAKFRYPSENMRSVLDYKTYGFTEADLDKTYYIDLAHSGAILSKRKDWKLRDLIEAYQNAYCKKIGVEFMHINNREELQWIRNKFENLQYESLSEPERVHMFSRLNWSHFFQEWFSRKLNTHKRFGLEGCESFVPGLKFLVDKLASHGAETFVIGMPHRGRLNVLANVVKKPLETIMAEF
jgi:2-oxoglutarate dehydrogenase E1 component